MADDTSTLTAYLAGERGRDVEALDLALAHNRAHLQPVVVTETLSAPNITARLARHILALPAHALRACESFASDCRQPRHGCGNGCPDRARA